MLKLLEKNTALQIIVILAVTTLLWLPSLSHPQPMEPPPSFAPLYDLLYNLSPSPLLSVILAILLILAGGTCLNIILVNASLVPQNTLLPTLLYTLFMSATATTLSSSLLVGVLAIAVVRMLLLHTTLLTIPSNKIFAATALIGICSLLYLPSLTLLLTYLLVVVSYRLYNWRDWMVLLLGLLAPYLLLLIVFYLNNTLSISNINLQIQLSAFNFQPSTPNFANALLLLLFLLALFLLARRLPEKTTLWQKNATTVLLLTVAALAQLPFSSFFPANLQPFAIPFALSATHLLLPDNRHRHPYRRQRKKHFPNFNFQFSIFNFKDLLLLTLITAAVLC
jgi:hypothetical protein